MVELKYKEGTCLELVGTYDFMVRNNIEFTANGAYCANRQYSGFGSDSMTWANKFIAELKYVKLLHEHTPSITVEYRKWMQEKTTLDWVESEELFTETIKTFNVDVANRFIRSHKEDKKTNTTNIIHVNEKQLRKIIE
jgi:hypothetical protein